MARGLTVGHEPVGVIDKLGSAVQGFRNVRARINDGDAVERR